MTARKTITYTAEELAWIRKYCRADRREAHANFRLIFNRTDVSLQNYNALCKRNGWLTGRDGRIKPGAKSWNTGKKMPYHPNNARTQFKKGQLPHNTKAAGHERRHEDGYIYISIPETNPHTGYERRFVLKHKHLWEQENGPVPAGMCLKCLDDNRENTDPSNWTLIPRGALPMMNGFRGPDYSAAEPEVKPAILTLAKLKHARTVKARQKRQES